MVLGLRAVQLSARLRCVERPYRAAPSQAVLGRTVPNGAAPRPPVLYSAMLNLKRPSCAVHSYKAPCFSQKAAKDCMPNP